MNVALRQPMTVEQFLAWEERQPLRYEFDGFRVIAMTGGTAAHSAIQRNLIFSLTGRLRGKPCQPYGSDLKVAVAGRIRYPDAFIVCAPIAPRATVVTEPTVVFEILSDSTASTDLITKNAEYRATPSIQHYVVLEQASAGVMLFSRKGADWTADRIAGPDAILSLPALDIAIPLAELYADIAFPADEPEPATEAAG